MAQIYHFGLQGLMPSEDSPPYAVTNPVRLPYGGNVVNGAAYVQGQPISIVAGTIQSEVITVTVADGTGTITFNFTCSGTLYQTTFAATATLAVCQTALEEIWGEGNVTVTGTAGTTYTITFSGGLANVRIGGLVAVTATTGTPTVARTTRGSSGAGQYDLYDSSTFTVVKGFLEYAFATTPTGDIVTDIPSTGQPSSMPAFTRGRFFVADLVTTGTYALDADAMTQGNLIFARGTALTDVGAVVELL